MSTGGITLLLAVTPHKFHGLTTIGTTIFILDVVLFFLLTSLVLTRFYLFPGTFTQSIHHQTESLFIPVRAAHIRATPPPIDHPSRRFSLQSQPSSPASNCTASPLPAHG